MRVLILRGPCGVGKSPFAQKILRLYERDSVQIFSATDYFENNKIYEFKEEGLRDAHRKCMRSFLETIQRKHESPNAFLIVDNTNISSWEISPYYAVSDAYGVAPIIVNFTANMADSVRLSHDSVHGVTQEKILQQIRRMYNQEKSFPEHWQLTSPTRFS